MGTRTSGGGVRTDLKRWMMFVDGENLVLRAQEFMEEAGAGLERGKYYEPNVFVWLPDGRGTDQWPFASWRLPLEWNSVRSHYYTSLTGDNESIEDVKQRLWSLDFQPEVFKRKRKGEKAKGVDIALCRDMLTHAYFGHYDVAVLISGDGDYVPLVEQVKRLGRIVCVAGFDSAGMSPDLKMSSDAFVGLGSPFIDRWNQYLKRQPKGQS